MTWPNQMDCAALVFATRLRSALVITLCAIWAASVSAQIPSPRPDGWVVDQTGTIRIQTITRLNEIGDAVARQNKGEIAVVVIETTHGRNHRQFATRLFNEWGVGSADRDDGVLVFAAMSDRKAEIILGDGVDDDSRVRIAERIMQQTMVPRFKQGDPGGALLAGTQECAQTILFTDLPLAAVSPVAMPRPDRNAAPRGDTPGSPVCWIIAAVLGIGGSGGGWLGIRQYYRYRKRNCPLCKSPMEMLGEVEDDKHLKPSELTEERISSVDYDIWSCVGCSFVSKRKFRAFFSRYATCPRCSARTKSSSSRTVRSPTYISTGLKEITDTCVHCSYHNTYTRSIPRRTKSSSSSSGSSGFSGGSSSGRGASGSW